MFKQCSVTRLGAKIQETFVPIARVWRHPWDLCPAARHLLCGASLCSGVQCLAEGTDNQAPDIWYSHPQASTHLQELCTGLWAGKLRGQSWACQWWIQQCRLPSKVPPRSPGQERHWTNTQTLRTSLPGREGGQSTEAQPAPGSSSDIDPGYFIPAASECSRLMSRLSSSMGDIWTRLPKRNELVSFWISPSGAPSVPTPSPTTRCRSVTRGCPRK